MEETAGGVPAECLAAATTELEEIVDEGTPADPGDAPNLSPWGGGPGGGPSGGGATCPLDIADIDAGSLTPPLRALLEAGELPVFPTADTERREAEPEVEEEDRLSWTTLFCSASGGAFGSMIRRPVADAKLGVAFRDGARRTAPLEADVNEVPGGCRVRMGGVGGV